MADDAVGDGARYWAFISYSHKDAAFGRRLHRRLENYALPRRLAGRATPRGIVPRRLTPIFRDREELPAAHDLSAEVRAALAASRSLIVVCSPSAAASPWVSREVELFRELHPDRPILAALAKGEPGESFPRALHGTLADGTAIEPLAADFRRAGDGAQAALLKLVAGIAGIGLDELVQRDAQRNLQRVTAVTAAALLAMLVMGLLTIFAFNARKEAERQRGEAEGLVGFMLTDLRYKLKGVGRLDIMSKVNERALNYYADENLDALPVASLERRTDILHSMGEDDETRGDYDAATAKFREAQRTTAALLAQAPKDPERIFHYAQTEYWLASVDYDKGRDAPALRGFESYRALAAQSVALAPMDVKYRRELAYADGNLCAVAEDEPRNPPAAMRFCGTALTEMEDVARRKPNLPGIAADLMNRHAWLADAYFYSNDLPHAKSERDKEAQILDREMAADPKNMDLKDTWIALQRAYARLENRTGHKDAALARLQHTRDMVDGMIEFDPKNHEWEKYRNRINKDLLKLK